MDIKTFVFKTINLFTDTIGLLIFGNVVYLTIKYKDLHTLCHILLGLYSLSQACSKVMLLPSYILYVLQSTIPIYVCVLIALIPGALMMGTFTFMVAIGIDRMLGICFPFWYIQNKSKLYRILLVGTPFLYPLYYLYLMIQDLPNNSPSNCLLNYVNVFNTLFPIICVIFTLFCYLIILLKAIFGKDPIGQSLREAILKSSATLIFIQNFGWICYLSVKFYITNYIEDNDQILLYGNFATIFSSLITIIEVLSLFITSSHLNALKMEFEWILKLFHKTQINNSVVITNIKINKIYQNSLNKN
uniref:G-protein coupled receptors family 1 profile domain-containing protein n=1 Tax=Meloidogyne enterolobii TaxID=390850 RepID=A0A6V7U2D7_MELEN|nr:unnamed protein product [Meloidogyne enterolobii]